MASSVYGVSFDPFAAGLLDAEEKAEIQRFIRVLDYEKHSGAEHRAVGCLMRLWNAASLSDELLSALKAINSLPSELAGEAWAIARAAIAKAEGK